MGVRWITTFGLQEYSNSQLLQLGDEMVDVLVPGLPAEAELIGEQLDDFRFAVFDLGRALGRTSRPLAQTNAEFREAVMDEIRTVPDDVEIPRVASVRLAYAKYLRLILKNLEYYAEKGTQPYLDLLIKCSGCISEEHSVAEGRSAGIATADSQDIAVSS